MKYFVFFILILIAFASCKNVQSQQMPDSNTNTKISSTKVEAAAAPQDLLKNLTKAQKKQLAEKIPPKIREILNNSAEISIYVNIDKENKDLRLLMYNKLPNTVAKISDASLKKQFLESFYYDVALSDGGSMCFAPRHRIKATFNQKDVELNLCYQCGNFEGKSSYGNFGGGLTRDNKSLSTRESNSLSIISEIIEKYRTEIQ